MRRHNIVSRIILILTVITFALGAPALVQDKRQTFVDVVHAPEEVITVLRKRMEGQNNWLEYVWGHLDHLDPAGIHLAPAPPPDVLPPNLAEVHVPGAHVAPQGPADSDRESMELNDDAPPGSPESGYSHSPPSSPVGSTESEDWHTVPTSPGSSTESDSNSDSDYWSTISNAPSEESLSKNLKAADTETGDKAKVSHRISGTASGVDTVAVDPGP
jgi:hypothetical protein